MSWKNRTKKSKRQRKKLVARRERRRIEERRGVRDSWWVRLLKRLRRP